MNTDELDELDELARQIVAGEVENPLLKFRPKGSNLNQEDIESFYWDLMERVQSIDQTGDWAGIAALLWQYGASFRTIAAELTHLGHPCSDHSAQTLVAKANQRDLGESWPAGMGQAEGTQPAYPRK